MIKKKLFKYGSVFMCAALIACSLTACGASNAASKDTNTAVQSIADNTDTEETLSQVIAAEFGAAVSTAASDSKEETVFVFTDSKGKQSHVIVNEKLKNASKMKTISDVTTLSDIVNLTGEETSSGTGNNLTWETNGNNITYQGTTTKNAPVTVKVTYYLDGREITPQDLAGKSGKVTMRFDYTNNEKQTVTVNGAAKEIYVPFTMVTGMLLPSDKFKNVEVTNGKLTETNDSNVVLGITMPGLKESLDLKFDNKKLDLEIPEYFEVTADVTDFELDMIMSAATSNFLSDIDTEDLSIDNLKEKVNELQSAADQLTDGTNTLAEATPKLAEGAGQLADGTGKLNEQVPVLTDGVTQLDNGAGQLTDGTGKLKEGADQIKTGTSQLADEEKGLPALQAGVSQYTAGVSQMEAAVNGEDTQKLAAGAAQVSDGLVQLSQQLSGTDGLIEGMVKLADGSAQVSDGLAQLSDGLNKSIAEYQNNQTKLQTAAQGLEKAGADMQTYLAALNNTNLLITPYTDLYNTALTQNQYSVLSQKYMDAYSFVENNKDNQVVMALNANIAANEMLKASGITSLSDIYKQEMVLLVSTAANESAGAVEKSVNGSVSKLSAGAAQVNNGLQAVLEKKSTLEAALGQLVAGSSQVAGGVSTLKSSLSTGIAQLTSNNDTLNNGMAAAADGAKKLAAGSPTLAEGINALDNGARQLKIGTAQLLEGAGALAGGVSQLNDGAKELSDGANQLNEGVITLRDGMTQFNEEGISQLTSLVGNDADTAVDTIKKIVELGKSYQSFAGKADKTEGSVTFIYKTDGIKK